MRKTNEEVSAMGKVVKGKDGVLGIVIHQHGDGAEVLFSDVDDEKLSFVYNGESTEVKKDSEEYSGFVIWYESFKRMIAQRILNEACVKGNEDIR